jgi:hypothetical protein
MSSKQQQTIATFGNSNAYVYPNMCSPQAQPAAVLG